MAKPIKYNILPKYFWRSIKSLFLASLGAIAITGGSANATWMKITITGKIIDGDLNETPFSNWSFLILPFGLTATTPGPGGTGSVQTTPYYGIGYSPPLVGFSSFTGDRFSGQYNSWGAPAGSDYLTFTNNTPSTINFKTGRSSNTGIKFQSPVDGLDYDVNFIELSGPMSPNQSGVFNPGGASSSDGTITGLISSALSTFTSPLTVSCATPVNCSGNLDTTSEDAFGLRWSTITFESLEGVPAPLPITGGVYFFHFSRRLRARTKAAKRAFASDYNSSRAT